MNGPTADPAEAGAMGERILAFIPMYNCQAQIGRVIAQFDHIGLMDGTLAILCLDNCSTDGTLVAAQRALDASNVGQRYLRRNDENYGLGGSHKVAFEFARQHRYDYIIVLHGDDQGSIADLMPLVRAGEHRRYDALLGARFQPGAKLQGYSLMRTAANHGFNILFSAVAGRRFYDLGSGLNMFRCAIFNDGFHLQYADNLTFNYYLVFGLSDHAKSILFFPITWREDDQVSNAKLFRQGFEMLRLLWRRSTDKARFLNGEHRALPRAHYPSTLVHCWGVDVAADMHESEMPAP